MLAVGVNGSTNIFFTNRWLSDAVSFKIQNIWLQLLQIGHGKEPYVFYTSLKKSLMHYCFRNLS